MVRYTSEQRIFLYVIHVECGSARKCRQKFRRKFRDEKVPITQTINNFFCFHGNARGDCSVGKATRYELRQEHFLFSAVSIRTLGSTQPSIQDVPGPLSLGVKQPGREADRSLPASADVKNDGTLPPLHHTSSWCGS
jgi:hypothetical protein